MSSIWQNIEIDWQGETYTVRPTLDFINHLEQGRGSSISMLFLRLTQGDMPSGKACEVIATTLNYAGATKVTAEDVFAETNGGIGVDVVHLMQSILVACMPEPKQTQATAQSTAIKKKPLPRSKKPSLRKSTGSR